MRDVKIRTLAAAVFGIALLVRLCHLWSFRASPFYLLPPLDGEVYLAYARNPVAGIYFQSPGYIHFLKAIFYFSDGPFAFRLVQCFLGAGTAALTTFIAAELVESRAAALVGGLSIALMGPLVAVDVWPALESPNVFAHALSCTALLIALRPAPPNEARGPIVWIALSALALGGAIVIRPSAMLMVPLVVVALLWPRPRRVGNAALFLVVTGLTVAPVTLHNLTEGDAVLVTASGGLNLYIGNGAGAEGVYRIPDTLPGAGNALTMGVISQEKAEHAAERHLRPSEVSDYFYAETRHDIAAAPGTWLRLMGKKVLLAVNWFEAPCSEDYYFERARSWPLASAFVTFGLIAPFAALGIAAAFRSSSRRRARLVVLGFLVAPLATIIIYFFLGRYRTPALPFFAGFAALGAETAYTLLRDARAKPARLVLAISLMTVVSIVVHLPLIPFNAAQEFTKAGTASFQLGRIDDASRDLEAALRLEPTNARALRNLAVVREAQARPAEARVLWQRLRAVAVQSGDVSQREIADKHLRLAPQE